MMKTRKITNSENISINRNISKFPCNYARRKVSLNFEVTLILQSKQFMILLSESRTSEMHCAITDPVAAEVSATMSAFNAQSYAPEVFADYLNQC